jgi:hypothetical protein
MPFGAALDAFGRGVRLEVVDVQFVRVALGGVDGADQGRAVLA